MEWIKIREDRRGRTGVETEGFISISLRAAFGQPSGSIRAAFGQPSGSLRAAFGQHSGSIRAGYGISRFRGFRVFEFSRGASFRGERVFGGSGGGCGDFAKKQKPTQHLSAG